MKVLTIKQPWATLIMQGARYACATRYRTGVVP